MGQERYGLRDAADAFALPRSLVTHKELSDPAKLVAIFIVMRCQSEDGPPSAQEIADDLGHNLRTIYRWLEELNLAKMLMKTRNGTRFIFSIAKHRKAKLFAPTGAPFGLTEMPIAPTITPFSSSTEAEYGTVDSRKAKPIDRRGNAPTINPQKAIDPEGNREPEQAITKPSRPRKMRRGTKNVHGGGGDLSLLEEDLTPPTTQPLQTAHARYMLRRGIFAAAEFDKPEYNSELWIAAVEGMFREGLSQQRIVTKLRLDPPQEADPYWRSLLEPVAPVAPPEPVSEPASFEAPASEPNELTITTLDRVWAAALGLLKMRMPRQVFAAHVAVAELASLENGTAQIIAPSAASKTVLEDQSTQIRDALSELLGTPVAVRIALAKARGQ